MSNTSTSQDPQTGTERILVVDDEDAIRHILRRILEGRGCEVQEAASAEEALLLLKNNKPEVALLDIILPGMNGLELLERIKKASADTEVLIMTSHSSAETALRAVRQGAFDYLEKPFEDLGSVWTKVERALQKRGLSRKNRELILEQKRKSKKISSAISLEPQRKAVEADPCKDLIEYFSDLAMKQLGATHLSLYMIDEESGYLELAGSRGFDSIDPKKARLRPGQGTPGTVLQTGESFLQAGDEKAIGIARRKQQDPSHPVLSRPIDMCLPLKSEARVLGVLNLGRENAAGPFSPDDLTYLVGITGQLAAAIEATSHSQRLQVAYEALKESHQQLVKSERTKAFGQMAAGVAHDFNNTLGVIIGRAQLTLMHLEKGDDDPDRLRSDLEVIKETALQSAEMVKRIQDYSRIRRDTPQGPVDINAIIRDAVEMSRPKWKSHCEGHGKQIETRFELPEIPVIRGHVYELIQVLSNLIFNAVEAMPDGGVLSFRSARAGDNVVIEVSDTGTGMDVQTRRQIFEPFFTTKKTGQGLGMSIVFGIVSRHEGRLEVDSMPGKGTTFRILLPCREPEAAPVTRKPAEKSEFRPVRILLVDDNEIVLETYKATLAMKGHDVLSAPDGETALSLLNQEDVDVLITDVSMSGMSGIDLAKQTKQTHQNLPVILLTGLGHDGDDKLKEAGADAMIAKPCLIEEMLRVIDETLHKAGKT